MSILDYQISDIRMIALVPALSLSLQLLNVVCSIVRLLGCANGKKYLMNVESLHIKGANCMYLSKQKSEITSLYFK